MNTSLLADPNYTRLILDSIERSKCLIAADPITWWEVLLINIRSQSIMYSQQKKFVENRLKASLTSELETLESIPTQSITAEQDKRLTQVRNHLKRFEDQEIEGHRVRTRMLPTFEKSEPNMSFFSRLEKRFIKQSRINSLKDSDGIQVTRSQDLLDVASKFYTELFTASKTDSSVQKALLKNVNKTLSSAQRDILDAPISPAELELAVKSLAKEKSPGINGFPAEFYQRFWPAIKDKYLEFVNHAFQHSFPISLNTSVTTLIYKDKGDIEDLAYYRPLSLINTDIKIISKALTNRLKHLLPHIIGKFQTALDGRQIDHTIHLIRDLIDLSNQENLDAAFIFLDQEKAFDRVDHKFLYKTMSAFGIGDNFITWVKQIYSTAVTRVKINGFLSEPISLKRGVRQGDPLSFLLYVLNAELFALMLRANKNIVGFQVGGEKIVSMHYADDTTITITQNRCFKEVIKDIKLYEKATGAKINLSKTKGLWTGSWKSRGDTPLGIEWTNKNVFNLGVYLGNDNPALKTFEKLIPKITTSVNFWKSFKLSILSKARVVEIFHASRLLYAAKFYCIPPHQVEILQRLFFDYVNFPCKVKATSQKELQKLRVDGGVKLINIQLKSEATKVQWLMSLCTNSDLSLHKALMERLVGVQKGLLTGIDLFFTPKFYSRTNLKITSLFYKEAITSMTSLDVQKQILDRYEENVFYNPIFCQADGKVITPTKPCMDRNICTYGQLFVEQGKMNRGESFSIGAINVLDKIAFKHFDGTDDFYLTTNKGKFSFGQVSQKMIYAELLRVHVHVDHHSSSKWVIKLSRPLDWEKIWKSVHNPLATDYTKTAVWAQLHLNDYTTASYNKWFKKDDPCPLCEGPIACNFHLILHCPVTLELFSDLEPFLKRISRASVTTEEMVFGLLGTTPAVHLRNWLTFMLREQILKQERIAHYNKLGRGNTVQLKHTFNARVQREICSIYKILLLQNRIDIFHVNYNPNRIFLIDPNGNVETDNIVEVI